MNKDDLVFLLTTATCLSRLALALILVTTSIVPQIP